MGEWCKKQDARGKTKTNKEQQRLQIVWAKAARPTLRSSLMWALNRERKKSKIEHNAPPPSPSLLVSIMTTPFFFHNFFFSFLSAIFLLFLYRGTGSEGMMIDAQAMIKRPLSFLLNHEFKEFEQGGGRDERDYVRGEGQRLCFDRCVLDYWFMVDRGRRAQK